MHWRLCHEMVLYLLVLLHGVTLYHYVTTCPLLISGISSSPHHKIVWLLLRKSEKRYMHVSANLEYSNRNTPYCFNTFSSLFTAGGMAYS